MLCGDVGWVNDDLKFFLDGHPGTPFYSLANLRSASRSGTIIGARRSAKQRLFAL